MEANRDGAEAKTLFDLEGGTCPSCAYAIEHLGRKVDGVHEVYVDVNRSTLEVGYEPSAERAVLQAIPEIVRRIGYRAALRER